MRQPISTGEAAAAGGAASPLGMQSAGGGRRLRGVDSRTGLQTAGSLLSGPDKKKEELNTEVNLFKRICIHTYMPQKECRVI